ncbi:hypothetical protein KIN20_030977 [Parelaphostrongylus tenuis]|uniref:Uncharacterized protein n=1 Tax=Parelaphostrongylus tenuis TaxID=148309 RepID=A0AAD5WGU8_PARTN|nr:hypothetical protein KIN20_030977 [Parelaphostrongylus tenuis]
MSTSPSSHPTSRQRKLYVVKLTSDAVADDAYCDFEVCEIEASLVDAVVCVQKAHHNSPRVKKRLENGLNYFLKRPAGPLQQPDAFLIRYFSLIALPFGAPRNKPIFSVVLKFV